MLISTPKQAMIILILWLTRIGGAIFTIGGLGFFILAWVDHTVVPAAMGTVVIAFGLFITSIRMTPDGGLEYGLYRSRRETPRKQTLSSSSRDV